MKNSKLLVIIYWFAFLTALLWMTSCSSKKIKNQITKEATIELVDNSKKEIETVENTNVKVQNDVLNTDETTINKTTYSPIDPTKPSSYTDSKGNKKELNNTSHTEERSTSKKQNKDTSVSDIAFNKISNETDLNTSSTRIKNKEANTTIDKESKTTSWWWLILILSIGVALYWLSGRIWWL